jgi:hypothetical protein
MLSVSSSITHANAYEDSSAPLPTLVFSTSLIFFAYSSLMTYLSLFNSIKKVKLAVVAKKVKSVGVV